MPHLAHGYRVRRGRQGADLRGLKARRQPRGHLLHGRPAAVQQRPLLLQRFQEHAPYLPVLGSLGLEVFRQEPGLPRLESSVGVHLLQIPEHRGHGGLGVPRLPQAPAQLPQGVHDPLAQGLHLLRLIAPGKGPVPLCAADAVFQGIVFQAEGLLLCQGSKAALHQRQHVLLPPAFSAAAQRRQQHAHQPVAAGRQLCAHIKGDATGPQRHGHHGRIGHRVPQGHGHPGPGDAPVVLPPQPGAHRQRLGKGIGRGPQLQGLSVLGKRFPPGGEEPALQVLQRRRGRKRPPSRPHRLPGNIFHAQDVQQQSRAVPLGLENAAVLRVYRIHGQCHGQAVRFPAQHGQQVAHGAREHVEAIDPHRRAGGHAAARQAADYFLFRGFPVHKAALQQRVIGRPQAA